MYTQMHVYMASAARTFMCIHMYMDMYMHMHMHVYMASAARHLCTRYMYVHSNVHSYVHGYVYINGMGIQMYIHMYMDI